MDDFGPSDRASHVRMAHSVAVPRADNHAMNVLGPTSPLREERPELDVLERLEPTSGEGFDHGTATPEFRPSLLCQDHATRRRMLDMEPGVSRARIGVFVVLASTLIALGPSIGWWPLAPLAVTAAGFTLADRIMQRSSRPEYWIMGAWGFSQLMIGLSIVLTGGPRSLFLPWLAIPAATLSARFSMRGVWAGVLWTVAIMVGVSLGIHPAVIAADPARLLVPLSLLGGIVLLTTALMHSDVKHRAVAVIDALTGLFNRRALAQRAGEIVDNAKATGSPMSVVIGDLDHFKWVNDRHGHALGDTVLRETADTLRGALRMVDQIYRYGGEEFVILLPGTDEAGALATSERLRAAVAGSHPAGLDLTMSFGVGVSEGSRTGFDELLMAADRALYQAKAQGRNRVCVSAACQENPSPAPTSLAARQQGTALDGSRATPASAFAAARDRFLKGQSLDMDELAHELAVSNATLLSWCGEREQLIGEILVSLSEATAEQARTDQRHASGLVKILAIYRQYVLALVHAYPLQAFLQNEPHTALEVLTSMSGHVHPHQVQLVHDLLREEQEAGTFVPKADLSSLAYGIVRLTEAFLYNDAILTNEPQVERAVRIVDLLLD